MIEFRLWGCDAPERGQAFFIQAKRFLESLVLNKPCTFVSRHVDTYSRQVIQLWTPDGADVSLEMILAGLAWFSRKHAPGQDGYLQAQHSACATRRGLWADSTAIAPWTFRHTHPTMHDRAMSPIKRRQKA